MYRNTLFTLVASASHVLADTIGVTPHDSYSSSIGVLGCKINTNRVAYWPGAVDCNNICVSVSYGGRSLTLLRVDQSGGAYDISYDAWNYLYTGQSATTDPVMGGAIEMDYTPVDASQCAPNIYTDGGKLPLSASNSMNFVASCLAQPTSWVAQNYALYNILDSACTYGYDEQCSLDWPANNDPTCPHTLGLATALVDATPVTNIQYGTGAIVNTAGVVVRRSNPSSAAVPSLDFVTLFAAFFTCTLLSLL